MPISTAEIKEALNQCACETLENLAFTEVVLAEVASLHLMKDQCLGARISLGPVGTLDLVMEKDFLAEVGGILFNPGPEELAADNLLDTVNEILNIIAGRFLEKWHEGQSDFIMGLPVAHLDLDEWNALPIRWVFANEGKPALAVGLAPSGITG